MSIPSSIYEESIYPFKSIENYFDVNGSSNISIDQLKNSLKNQKKMYIMAMLPYPSGQLHMGHIRNYLYVDILARYYRSQKYAVLNPLGWDSFGLPAENAAKEASINPRIWTENNIEVMKKTIKNMGFDINWSMEITTHSSEYYHQQQKIFLDIFKKKLCYKKKGLVFWDPKEKSVLSKEQVIDGKGWRSGVDVEMKIMDQWYLKITDYVEELIKDLDNLPHWPEDIKTMQRNWMAPTQGFIVEFPMVNSQDIIKAFTTKPQMLYGCTFIGLSLTHDITIDLSQTNESINNFIKNSLTTMDEKNYSGIFTGMHAINPINNQSIPIYITTYVNNHFGTGAIYGVPSHNLNDYNFAQAHHIPMMKVMEGKEDFVVDGLMINSPLWNDQSQQQALETLKNLSLPYIYSHTVYNLHDWCFARQRYWGCPIPLIHCNHCGIVEANIIDNPVVLPEDVDFSLDGNPLDNHPTWKFTHCPQCSQEALRETSTMDTFVDSSWYFYRYLNPNFKDPIDNTMVNLSMAVDIYIGGREHAVSHLLYCRFFTKLLRDLGYININEPVKQLNNQGFVCMATYYDTIAKKYIFPKDVQWINGIDGGLGNYDHDKKMLMVHNNNPVIKGPVQKMSKSKKNIIDPMEIKEVYGVDVMRFAMISDNPMNINMEIKEESFNGPYRFLNEVWVLGMVMDGYDCSQKLEDKDIHQFNQLIIKTQNHIENLQFNLLAVDYREMVKQLNQWIDNKYETSLVLQYFNNFINLFSYTAPYISHGLNYRINKTHKFCDILLESAHIDISTIKWGIMVNNKFINTLELDKSLDEDAIKKAVHHYYNNNIGNQSIKKIIIIANGKSMININV